MTASKIAQMVSLDGQVDRPGRGSDTRLEREPIRDSRWIAWGALCLVLAMPGPATAEEEDRRWTLRAVAGAVSTADDVARVAATQSGPITAGGATHEIGDGTELGLELEYRWTRRLGVELGYFVADHDTSFTLEGDGFGPGEVRVDEETAGIETMTAGVAYHLRPGRRVDVVLGAFVAMSKADDLVFNTEIGRRDKLSFDDDVGPGVKAGVVVPLGPSSRWHLVAEARYLSAILEADSGGEDLAYDPLTVAAGIGYRW